MRLRGGGDAPGRIPLSGTIVGGMIDIRTWEGEGGSSGLIVEGFVDTLIEEGEGEGEARGSIRSVGDEPQTPEGEGETGGSIGQRPNIWEEMFGWEVETQDCNSTQSGNSNQNVSPRMQEEREEERHEGPLNWWEVETQTGPEEHSAMVLWNRSRGLLMEKTNGKYRFMGGIFEVGDYPQPDCDTYPTEVALGATEITAGRELGSVFCTEELAIRHFTIKSYRGGGGRSGHAFRSRGGRLTWVQPDWAGGEVGLSDLWECAAHVWGAVHEYASHSSGARHIPL